MLEARPLDFGHWSAHKLEVLTNFAMRHGEAVAIGVAIDTVYSSLALGFAGTAGAAGVCVACAIWGSSSIARNCASRSCSPAWKNFASIWGAG